MKLQLALDGELTQSLAVLEAAAPFIDIVEIGTPLIYREGMRAVREARKAFPHLIVLADLKIMDAGGVEADLGFEAGADVVTVLGVTNDATVRGAVKAAQRAGKTIMIDLMQVANPVTRGRELLAMGCDYLCVHTAHDLQSGGHSPLETLTRLRQALPEARVAVAGGINLSTVNAIVALKPEIIVVGSAITGTENVAEMARELRGRITSY
jgi:3-hexulose-6-phosphate synthase